MSTQTGGGTPHTCKALEHCHQLNERVADLESELATPSLRALVGTLRDELAQYRSDSLEWHNRLAQEWRAHDVALQALQATEPATDCGGCAGQGAHKRWCPEVVGAWGARLGKLAEEADSLGDRIGANDPVASSHCWKAAAALADQAATAGEKWRATR